MRELGKPLTSHARLEERPMRSSTSSSSVPTSSGSVAVSKDGRKSIAALLIT